MASEDERPVPKGYRVWRDADGMFHALANTGPWGHTRDEAIDACERHQQTILQPYMDAVARHLHRDMQSMLHRHDALSYEDALRERDAALVEVERLRARVADLENELVDQTTKCEVCGEGVDADAEDWWTDFEGCSYHDECWPRSADEERVD